MSFSILHPLGVASFHRAKSLGSRCIWLIPVILVCVNPVNAAPASTTDGVWANWVLQQVNSHPQVTAAKQTMKGALQSADAKTQPIYNPTLDTQYEHEGDDNNYLVGVSQSVDWWDKRSTYQQQAHFSRVVAEQTYHKQVQYQAAHSLKTLIRWRSAKQQADISLQLEEQLDTLIELVSKRQSSGDLGEIDAQLVYLSLSGRLNETASAQAQLRKVTEQVYESMPAFNEQHQPIPQTFWTLGKGKQNTSVELAEAVDSHPEVVTAKAQWQLMQQGVELAKRQAKADPTFSLGGGKSNGENVVALSVSIPLFVRNNFAGQTDAAVSNSLAAKATYASLKRKKRHGIKGTRAALNEYQQRYQRWLSVVKDRVERSEVLLNKQWRSGDLSTTEFLLALEQRSKGLIAGIELRTSAHLAQIDWLLQTGQLIHILDGFATNAAANKE
ncbi:MAG: outer membrane protein TolC [Alteromonadaceae bacterium]|jgi:outer membrane protein TolC